MEAHLVAVPGGPGRVDAPSAAGSIRMVSWSRSGGGARHRTTDRHAGSSWGCRFGIRPPSVTVASLTC